MARARDIDVFDYVIVGGGAAGSLLAARLAEKMNATVCILEAGSNDWNPFLHIPAGFIKVIFDPRYTWGFETEPGPNIYDRKLSSIQGKVLGGSASINGMIYVRGQAQDYNDWASFGNPGWSYCDVLPYFRKTERRVGAGDEQYRGRLGPIPVTDLRWRDPLTDAFVASAEKQGIPFNPDYNGASQAGTGRYQYTIDRRWRKNSLKTILRPALARHSIDIRTSARALSLLFEGKRAVGVAYQRGNEPVTRKVEARREVIVSCGAINTPRLMQLSGVGPPSVLAEFGIPVVHANNAVGENLRDHYAARVVYRARPGIVTINELTRGPKLLGQIGRWFLDRPNVLSFGLVLGNVYWMSDETLERPDICITFTPASFHEGLVGALDNFPGMTVGVWQLRPESRGTVRLRSRDPLDPPRIQPRHLQEETDRKALVGGLRLARKIMATPDIAAMVESETMPGIRAASEADLLEYARRSGHTTYHSCGTSRMGPADDPASVVDPQLRVIGLDGLRIVDASIMPTMVSGNTMAATMMIAEKAADMIAA